MYADEYKRQGVTLLEAFGVSYPAAFTDPLREYRALTGGVALIDLSHWGLLRLRGSDRVEFLNSQITGDVATLEPGRSSHAALTTSKGRLVAELFVLKREQELVVVVAQGNVETVFESLDKHIIADDVELANISKDHAILSIEGPACREVVWRIFPNEELPSQPLEFVDKDYQGVPVTVLRNAMAGERGFQLILSGEGSRLIRDYVLQAGVGMDMEQCGYVAWNMRRVEAGRPWWDLDVDNSFPKECRLDHLVDYDKGCFLGQETLARMHHRGHPNWLLVGLEAHGAVPPALEPPPGFERFGAAEVGALRLDRLAGVELRASGEPQAPDARVVGRLTSPVFSPASGRFLSLGSVRHTMAEPGTRFALRVDGQPVELEVITLPIEAKES